MGGLIALEVAQPTGSGRRRGGAAGHVRHAIFRSPSFRRTGPGRSIGDALARAAPEHFAATELKKLPLERAMGADRGAGEPGGRDRGGRDSPPGRGVQGASGGRCSVIDRSPTRAGRALPGRRGTRQASIRGGSRFVRKLRVEARARQSLQHVAQTARRRAGGRLDRYLARRRRRRTKWRGTDETDSLSAASVVADRAAGRRWSAPSAAPPASGWWP